MSNYEMLIEAFQKRFAEIEKMLDGGDIKTRDLAEKVESLCHDIQAAPAEASDAVKDDLAKMISKLDTLAHSMGATNEEKKDG